MIASGSIHKKAGRPKSKETMLADIPPETDIFSIQPFELLLKIVGFLGPRELIRISAVSTLFRMLAEEEEFWIQSCRDVWKGKKHHPTELHWRGDFRHLLPKLSTDELRTLLRRRLGGATEVLLDPISLAKKLKDCPSEVLANKSWLVGYLLDIPDYGRLPHQARERRRLVRPGSSLGAMLASIMQDYTYRYDEDDENSQDEEDPIDWSKRKPIKRIALDRPSDNFATEREALEYLVFETTPTDCDVEKFHSKWQQSYFTAVVDSGRKFITISELMELKWKFVAQSFYGGDDRAAIVVFRPDGYRGSINTCDFYPHLQPWRIEDKYIQVASFSRHHAKRAEDWGWSFENNWVEYTSLEDDEIELVTDESGVQRYILKNEKLQQSGEADFPTDDSLSEVSADDEELVQEELNEIDDDDNDDNDYIDSEDENEDFKDCGKHVV